MSNSPATVTGKSLTERVLPCGISGTGVREISYSLRSTGKDERERMAKGDNREV